MCPRTMSCLACARWTRRGTGPWPCRRCLGAAKIELYGISVERPDHAGASTVSRSHAEDRPDCAVGVCGADRCRDGFGASGRGAYRGSHPGPATGVPSHAVAVCELRVSFRWPAEYGVRAAGGVVLRRGPGGGARRTLADGVCRSVGDRRRIAGRAAELCPHSPDRSRRSGVWVVAAGAGADGGFRTQEPGGGDTAVLRVAGEGEIPGGDLSGDLHFERGDFA